MIKKDWILIANVIKDAMEDARTGEQFSPFLIEKFQEALEQDNKKFNRWKFYNTIFEL